MQRIDAEQQPSAERLFAVAAVIEHPSRAIEDDPIEGTDMLGLVGQVPEGRLTDLARRIGQQQAIALDLSAGFLPKALPERIQVHVLARHHAADPGLRRRPQQSLAGLAIPVIGPVQTGQRRQQIDQQAPGARHGVQVPVETPPPTRPVEGQPGAPAPCLARPAQVEAGQAEHQQDQGGGPGQGLAYRSQGQGAVQVQDQAKESLAARRLQHLAGVAIEQQHLATALAARRRQAEQAVALPRHAGDEAQLPVRRHEALPHFRQCQRTPVRRRGGRRRIEQFQQLQLKAVERPRHPQHHQHQARRQPEQAVQLEQTPADQGWAHSRRRL